MESTRLYNINRELARARETYRTALARAQQAAPGRMVLDQADPVLENASQRYQDALRRYIEYERGGRY
jgi:hypothetical protein